ncbi:MAG TPA: transposase, partial [Chitinophagaceae bacterium]|nr:transposase [Chitinophagaceae bacterium]
LKKHWPVLWTFLSHTGVPWNNNNAEAAIKAFALHRRDTNGIVSEKGLAQYLSMLTIAQTCRFRNLSFLDCCRGKIVL